MRAVPADLHLADTPADFAINPTDDGQVIAWRGSIGGRRYALGLRPVRTTTALDKAAQDLRNGVWQLMEFGRLGRVDLMQFASAERHLGRKKA